jgi:RHS repeat-associated protein
MGIPRTRLNTGRVTFAHSIHDDTLDRSWHYDQVGRLDVVYSGSEARATIGTDSWCHPTGPYAQVYQYDQFGNMTRRYGWGGWMGASIDQTSTYTNNKDNALVYDASGNLISDGSQTYTYDVTGQQATASGTNLSQSYDGDGKRVKKTDSGDNVYYLRSTVLGGQVVAEIRKFGTVWDWSRGYVYSGSQLLAIQSGAAVSWVHQEPYSKGQRITDASGAVTSIVELDPWGGDTARSANQAFQPHRFTTYERDANGGDDAMARRYHGAERRFAQPDPLDGSYNYADPQSLNRYAYTQNDPVNFMDPSGLNIIGEGYCWIIREWNDHWDLVNVFCSNFGGAGDNRGTGDGGAGGRQESQQKSSPSPTPQPNPNCIQNAASADNTSLARPFGNVGPTGIIGHDRIHVVAPPGSKVTTLAPLAGTVLGIHDADGGKTHIVDVLLDNGGFVALYKDLVTVNVRPGKHLGAGTSIGTIGAYEGGGLHFALLNGGRQADRYYRRLTSTGQTDKIMVGMFTNPNGPNSPVNCPGVPVDNAGVNPHP